MRKIIISLAIACFTVAMVSAQKTNKPVYKPFKVDVSLGYAIPGGTGAKGGVLFAIEPKYAVASNISVGLRIESAITVTGTTLSSSSISNSTFTAQASASYLLTGDYYFSMEDFKPFAGAGIGEFTTAGVKASNGSLNNNVAGASTKFGEMIRAGFEWKHLRFGIEYNIVGETTVPPTTSTSGDGYNIKNSYLGIKLGVLIGGGKK